MFINKSLLGSMQHRVLSEPKKLGAIRYGLQVQIQDLGAEGQYSIISSYDHS